MGSNEFDLMIDRKEVIAQGVVRLTLARMDGTDLPAWTPGAHIDVHLKADAGLTRQYSLCGDPADRGHWQVAVLDVPGGRGGSAYIHQNLMENEVLTVSGPRNNFELVPAERYLFIAGGIGITPIIPMIAVANKAGIDWRLLYTGRSFDSMAFTDELLEFYSERVEFRPRDTRGRLDLAGALAVPSPGTLIYSCGPESLLQGINELTSSWPDGSVHTERFAAVTDYLQAPRAAFEVEFVRSGITLTVPADRSILEIAEDAGIDIDSSCQEGTCGTCETAVLEGLPDHRDSLLSDAERQANQTMMVCVSRACSRRLVLDA